MLALSRTVDEEIILGDNLVRIIVLSVKGKHVRLGIQAPVDMAIHRREVYEAIKREREEGENA